MKALILVLFAAIQLMAAGDTTTYTYVRKSDTTCTITLKLFNVRPWVGIENTRAIMIDYRTKLSKPATQWCYNSQPIADRALVYLTSNGCPNQCPYNVPPGYFGCSSWDSGTFTHSIPNNYHDSMAVLSVSIHIYKWIGGGTFARCDTGGLIVRHSWRSTFSGIEKGVVNNKKINPYISVYDISGRLLSRSTTDSWRPSRPGLYLIRRQNGSVSKTIRM